MLPVLSQLCVNCYCELMIVVGSKPSIGMGTGNSRGTSFPSQHQRTPDMESEEVCNVPFNNWYNLALFMAGFFSEGEESLSI